jgi:hypothetical protein
MEVDLDKEDLIALVRSTDPNYELFENPFVKPFGDYQGGFYDRWIWKVSDLHKLTEHRLWELYKMCKDSWTERRTI